MLAGGATKSAMSNQSSGPGSSSFPSPIRFGQDGAPLLTPVFRKTVKGRPVLGVEIPNREREMLYAALEAGLTGYTYLHETPFE